MAKIKLSQDREAYVSYCEIDTNIMDVEIREAFQGVIFVTEDGEKLIVHMRDNGFEVDYSSNYGKKGFDCGVTYFQNGFIKRPKQ